MLKNKAVIFKALSDQNRLKILKMLRIKPLCVTEITKALGLAVSTVSKHLSILKNAGFLVEEKSGKWVVYNINPDPPDSTVSSILGLLNFWLNDD